MIKAKRALISVSDKKGLVPFAKGLQALGIEIISTGGTAKHLKDAGIPVQEVSDYTGFPEMLDGRVKTLHPKIHGGLLALRDRPEHMEQLRKNNIGTIDMVVVNLYPFESVIKKRNVPLDEAIENIDIGGPALLRSAAKNFKSVAVICNPDRYPDIIKELDTNSGLLSDTVLFNLAIETFQHTTHYDGIIASYLQRRLRSEEFSSFPKEITLKFSKWQDLRYGENPHQAAAFYRDFDAAYGLADMKQLNGKELSFNNILDLNAAVESVKDFQEPAAVIIKHGNPTGVAEDKTLAKAFYAAWQCDTLSAFGGIIGLNRKVDGPTAKLIDQAGFMECVMADGFDREALKILSRKKNLRLMEINFHQFKKDKMDFKKVYGGLLLQDKDERQLKVEELKFITKRKPAKDEIESCLFGWKVIKNIKSNAVILVKDRRTIGIGCGQTSRIESIRIAIQKAGKNAKNAVLISDAFLPHIDNVQLSAKAGINVIVQTGGSVADPDVIKAAEKARIAMAMTGIRHFKH